MDLYDDVIAMLQELPPEQLKIIYKLLQGMTE